MISVEVDQISPTKDGLRLGCVVRYGEGGPVRFVEAFLPYDVIDKPARASLIEAFNAAQVEWLDSEPLF